MAPYWNALGDALESTSYTPPGRCHPASGVSRSPRRGAGGGQGGTGGLVRIPLHARLGQSRQVPPRLQWTLHRDEILLISQSRRSPHAHAECPGPATQRPKARLCDGEAAPQDKPGRRPRRLFGSITQRARLGFMTANNRGKQDRS